MGRTRDIVARAGITLYRVVTITHRPDGRVLVAVDGGVSDHPKSAPATAPVRMVGRPPVVAVHGVRARLLVRRETYADLRVRDAGR